MATTSIGSSGVTFPDSSTQASSSGVAKAWARFSVSGTTVSINKQYNISSVTRNAAGYYTISFTNSLPDANYGCTVTTGIQAGASTTSYPQLFGTNASPYYLAPTTSSFTLAIINASDTAFIDSTYTSIVIND